MFYGGPEGRSPNKVFNTKYYLEQNPDVKSAGMNPLVHYLEYGKKEGRRIQPSQEYLSSNHDKMNACQSGHYWRFKTNENNSKYPGKIRMVSKLGNHNPLTKYFYSKHDNLIYKWIHYFDIYHHHFQRYVGKESIIVEIGVFRG